MNEQHDTRSVEQNLKSRSAWMRLLYMLLFGVILWLLGMVLSAVAIIQFLIYLLSGQANPNLREFGQGIATYAYQIIQFLCFNSEAYPFPFAPWPEGPPGGAEPPTSGPDEAEDQQSGV